MDSHGGDKKTLRKVKQRIQKRRQKRSKQKLQRRTKRKQRITKRKINKKGGGANESEKTVVIKIIESDTGSGFLEVDNNDVVIINIEKIYETDIFDKLVEYKLKTLEKYELKDIHFSATFVTTSGTIPKTEPYNHIKGIISLVEQLDIEDLKHMVSPLSPSVAATNPGDASGRSGLAELASRIGWDSNQSWKVNLGMRKPELWRGGATIAA